jgi:hypothetical protein
MYWHRTLEYAVDSIYRWSYSCAMVEVIATDEFAEWYRSIADQQADAVAVAVERLEQLGLGLGFPYSSAVRGATFALRELRIKTGGRALRVMYAFDPKRQAVLLLGGDKSGEKGFYERLVGKAEKVWKAYLAEV